MGIPSMISEATTKKEIAKAMKNQDPLQIKVSPQSTNVDSQKEPFTTSKRNKSPKTASNWSSPTPRTRVQPPSGGKAGSRQGAWKEALGPQRGKIGFNSTNRRVKSGYEAWRKMVTSSNKSKDKKPLDSA